MTSHCNVTMLLIHQHRILGGGDGGGGLGGGGEGGGGQGGGGPEIIEY